MKLKVYKTENDGLRFIEIEKPFTLADFTVETKKPEYDGYREIEASFQLYMKRPIVEYILSIFPFEFDGELADKTDQEVGNIGIRALGQYSWHIKKVFTYNLDFRGIRKQETKDNKVKTAILEVAGDMMMNSEKYVQQMIDNANGILERKLISGNNNYTEYMKNLYSGKNISEDWKRENLDDSDVNDSISETNFKITALKAELEKLEIKQSEARNKNMFLYLEGENWGENGELGHDAIPQFLRDEFTELYSKNEAFTVEKGVLRL